MTPDSSRYWPADSYRPGGPQASFDKQFVRDYLEQIRWNKQPPVPTLPDGGGGQDAGQVPGGISTPDRRGDALMSMRDELDSLVFEMLTQGDPLRRRPPGVREAVHQPRPQAVGGQCRPGGRAAGHAPQHPEPENPRIPAQAQRLGRFGLDSVFLRPSLELAVVHGRLLTCRSGVIEAVNGPAVRPAPEAAARGRGSNHHEQLESRDMKVRPLHDRIIVQRLEEGEQKIGGIIIPDTAKEKPQQGKVIAVGRRQGQGRRQPSAARREGRRHHPLRQVLRPGNQDRRRGVPDHARRRSAGDSRVEVTRFGAAPAARCRGA